MRALGIGMTIQAATTAYASEPSLSHLDPKTGNFFGYEFEWGPLIAGLLMCFAVRFYVSKTEPEHKWTVDAPVTVIALAFTAGIIQQTRPIPLLALVWGTGMGALGVGIIRMALSFVKKNMPFAEPGDDAPTTPNS